MDLKWAQAGVALTIYTGHGKTTPRLEHGQGQPIAWVIWGVKSDSSTVLQAGGVGNLRIE